MKYFITAFLGAYLLSACNHQQPTTEKADSSNNPVDIPVVDVSRLPMEARIMGTYKGDFGGSPIYITINYCSGTKIAGYNTHKGLRRNLSGSMTDNGSTYSLTLSEPGDHEFDGVFHIKMDTSLASAAGSWKPTNSKALSQKSFTLNKLIKDQDYPTYFSGDHCDLSLDDDGNCTLNYYDKVTDSTFSGQMKTLKGTWEKRGRYQFYVNWQANDFYAQRATLFAIQGDTTAEDAYMGALKGDNFELSSEFY